MMPPPGVPADRLAVLRKAFDAMVKDPAFKQEIEQRNLEFGRSPARSCRSGSPRCSACRPRWCRHAIAASR